MEVKTIACVSSGALIFTPSKYRSKSTSLLRIIKDILYIILLFPEIIYSFLHDSATIIVQLELKFIWGN